MVKFIDNVNTYLTEMKIKKSFLGIKSGIESSKLSRILNKTQEVSGSEMDLIARALGKKLEFFLAEDFFVPKKEILGTGELAFYAGNPTHEQEEFAKQFLELIENADEIISAKSCYGMICEE